VKACSPVGARKTGVPGREPSSRERRQTKAKAAAIAEYPEGTVNRVLELSDGSYAVHRIATPAPHHIFVSKDFKVTGTS
jgi:hypothetical protein